MRARLFPWACAAGLTALRFSPLCSYPMAPTAAAQLLLAESLGLALLVLALFWSRRRFGLTPLYVSLGVFQPMQVLLSSSVYVELWPGVEVSPGAVLFAASLLAILA